MQTFVPQFISFLTNLVLVLHLMLETTSTSCLTAEPCLWLDRQLKGRELKKPHVCHICRDKAHVLHHLAHFVFHTIGRTADIMRMATPPCSTCQTTVQCQTHLTAICHSPKVFTQRKCFYWHKSIFGQNANITLWKNSSFIFWTKGWFFQTLHCEQFHQPITMVVQNWRHIYHQQLTSSLSVSLSARRCLTNKMKILKTTILTTTHRKYCWSVRLVN